MLKESNMFLVELLEQEAITQDQFENIIFKLEINAFSSSCLSSPLIENINWGWSAWQIAKKKAVPVGYTLVPNEATDEMVKAVWKSVYMSDFMKFRKSTFDAAIRGAYKTMITTKGIVNFLKS